MKNKRNFKKTPIILLLALSALPIPTRNLPPIESVPSTPTPGNIIKEEPEIQPLNDKDPKEVKKG